MKPIRLFYLVLTLMFVFGGYKVKEFNSPLQAGAAPILNGEICSKSALGTYISISASEVYPSNPHQRSARRSFLGKTHIWPVEKLRQIPGPKFLVVFIALVVICIGVGWFWITADGTGSYPLPKLTRFDPFAIAALRGGSAAVIRAAVFSLWSQGHVEISVSKSFWTKKEVEVKSVLGRMKELSPIEYDIHDFLITARNPRDLFQDRSLKNRIEQHLGPVYRDLEELHLFPNNAQKTRAYMIAIAMTSVIVLVGGGKLWLGFWNNKPLAFLGMLLVVSPIVLFAFLKSCGTPTKLGRRYLKSLKKQFDWLKGPANLDKNAEGIDPAFSVAVFGIGILAGASMYEAFSEAFPLSKAGFFGGGCGGGCGGGGCGGGCGGCGGCGG